MRMPRVTGRLTATRPCLTAKGALRGQSLPGPMRAYGRAPRVAPDKPADVSGYMHPYLPWIPREPVLVVSGTFCRRTRREMLAVTQAAGIARAGTGSALGRALNGAPQTGSNWGRLRARQVQGLTSEWR